MFKFEAGKNSNGGGLEPVDVRNLYNDEIIDLKYLNEDYAIFCTNSEFIKLLDLHSGMIEQYRGHGDIIITLDKYSSKSGDTLILTGSKDQTIRLWRFDASLPVQQKIWIAACFKGHTDNLTCVSMAPKHGK